MKLHELTATPGSTRPSKRIGRGPASGQGKTSGKGHKGQKSRSGGHVRIGFEGGQMPLQRRIPKRGFHNIFAKSYAVVNLSVLNDLFDNSAAIDEDALVAAGAVKDKLDGIKILGNGEISKKLNITATSASKTAIEKIKAAGGTITIVKEPREKKTGEAK